MVLPLLPVVMSTMLLADPKALAKQLFNRDQAVVLKTIQALGETGKPEAVAPLCRVLSEGAPVLRVAAANALGQLRLNKSLQCLTAANDADPEVQAAVTANAQRGSVEAPWRLVLIQTMAADGSDVPDEALKKIDALVRKKLAAFRFAQALPTDSTEDLTDLVKARKLKTALHLRVRVTWAAEELTTEIMALSFPDNALRGSWRVSGKGAALPELVDAVVPSVVDDAAGDLELK